MVAQGLAIIFISHKLGEVLRVSHRVAVLRPAGWWPRPRGRHRCRHAGRVVGQPWPCPSATRPSTWAAASAPARLGTAPATGADS
jgi:hypothetical protein